MITTRWFGVMDALGGRWWVVADDGARGVAGACMYFCSVALVAGVLLF